MKDNKNLFKKMDAFLEDSTNSLAFLRMTSHFKI